MRDLPIEIDATPDLPLGMPARDFLRDYWQKRPLLIRNAFADFVAPLTPEDLAGLACEEEALSRLVEYDRAADAWQVRSGPFAESVFPALPPQDWTLLVQDVDKWDADVASLLPHFDFLPRWRIDDVMVSFAAPGGSVGAHVDQYDVFLLQGPGRRRWQIDARRNPPTAFRGDVELKLLSEFDPSHEWMLGPGDMLYLPPGVPHHGVAEQACLTFSIGMRAPSQAEMLVDFAEFVAERLPEESRYRDADLEPAAELGEIDAAALRRAMAALPWVRFEGDADVMERAGGIDRAGAITGPPSAVDSMPRDGGTRPAGYESPQPSQRVAGTGTGTGVKCCIDPASFRTWFGQFITRYRSAGDIAAPPKPPALSMIETRLQKGAALVRHPFCRTAWMRRGDTAELFVDGESQPASLALARCVGDPAPIDHARWAALDGADRAALHDLVARGRYALSRPPRQAG